MATALNPTCSLWGAPAPPGWNALTVDSGSAGAAGFTLDNLQKAKEAQGEAAREMKQGFRGKWAWHVPDVDGIAFVEVGPLRVIPADGTAISANHPPDLGADTLCCGSDLWRAPDCQVPAHSARPALPATADGACPARNAPTSPGPTADRLLGLLVS